VSTPGSRSSSGEAGRPFPFGQALPAPGPVPSSWFLTTWTVSSTRMVRVCCAPLPTEVRRVSRVVGSIRVEPDGTARAIPATRVHTPRRTPLASSRTVSPRPLPSCRYRSFRHLRELPRAGAGSCTAAGRTVPAFLCPGVPCGKSDIAGIAGTTRFHAVNAGCLELALRDAWPDPRPEGRLSLPTFMRSPPDLASFALISRPVLGTWTLLGWLPRPIVRVWLWFPRTFEWHAIRAHRIRHFLAVVTND
jgi:hypothetical protein